MKIRILVIVSLFVFFLSNCKKDSENSIDDFVILYLLFAATSNSGPDPLFRFQWHLKNEGTTSTSIAGADSNVEPVWNEGITGDNINIVVIDDGVDLNHEDLKINPTFNIDFTSQLPSQVNGTASCDNGNACHGTAVAGVAAATANNGKGGKGTAPGASISGRNFLLQSNSGLFANLGVAMAKDIANIHISNNSWGALDSTGRYNSSFANSTWKNGIEEGLSIGRGGLGALYFWAGGNGGKLSPNINLSIDNSNYDGQANYPGVNAICAIGNRGEQVYYSERGANLLVCGYSEGDNNIATTTTDVMGSAGYNPFPNRSPFSSEYNNNYTNIFNGTSSATPNVAGVAALILSARSDLSWRDVRGILARSARKTHPTNVDWTTNAVGYNINHNYGFGAVDAQAAVRLARDWSIYGSELSPAIVSGSATNLAILENSSSAASSTNSNTVSSSIQKIESIEITVTVNANTNLGDVLLVLESPQGTRSNLNEPHPCLSITGTSKTVITEQTCHTGSLTWTYSSLRHMDENPNGIWKLYYIDRVPSGTTYLAAQNTSTLQVVTIDHANAGAQLSSWSMKIRGRAN